MASKSRYVSLNSSKTVANRVSNNIETYQQNFKISEFSHPLFLLESIKQELLIATSDNFSIILITFMLSYCLQKFLNSWMFFGKTPKEEISAYNLVTLKFLSTSKSCNLL